MPGIFFPLKTLAGSYMNTKQATVIGWHKEKTECVCECVCVGLTPPGPEAPGLRCVLVCPWLAGCPLKPQRFITPWKPFPMLHTREENSLAHSCYQIFKKKKRLCFREERRNRAAARMIGSRRELTIWPWRPRTGQDGNVQHTEEYLKAPQTRCSTGAAGDCFFLRNRVTGEAYLAWWEHRLRF